MHTKQIIKNILAVILVIITGHFLPWWSFAIITLIIGYISNTERESYINGFIIGFMCWFTILIYDYYNGGNILFIKMSSLLKINKPIILIILSSILSGIVGVISSWTGWQFSNKEGKDD